MTKLHNLYESYGQSPWLDNLRREWLHDGTLASWVQNGIRGLTSNPSIFQQAMTNGTAYELQFSNLLAAGLSVAEAYWELVYSDINGALDVFAPVYAQSGGTDGYVSVEVDPKLAHNAESTLKAALEICNRIARPNLLVKIPGTKEGLAAIQAMTAQGHSVNVTLLFSLTRYSEVIEAYLQGLEAHPGDLSHITGVASFFISRTDTKIDQRLAEIGTTEAFALHGLTAVAQGQLAYQIFKTKFSGPRWEALSARGANVQKPLWASTSTKNPAYADTLYVDSLIGPQTVNTLPDATLKAFLDHGTVARTVDADLDAAQAILDRVTNVGVDLDDVAKQLEHEGLAAFMKSFDDLLASLHVVAKHLSAKSLTKTSQ